MDNNNNKPDRKPGDSIFSEWHVKAFNELLDYLYGPEEKEEADND